MKHEFEYICRHEEDGIAVNHTIGDKDGPVIVAGPYMIQWPSGLIEITEIEMEGPEPMLLVNIHGTRLRVKLFASRVRIMR